MNERELKKDIISVTDEGDGDRVRRREVICCGES